MVGMVSQLRRSPRRDGKSTPKNWGDRIQLPVTCVAKPAATDLLGVGDILVTPLILEGVCAMR